MDERLACSLTECLVRHVRGGGALEVGQALALCHAARVLQEVASWMLERSGVVFAMGPEPAAVRRDADRIIELCLSREVGVPIPPTVSGEH